jgi:dTMP kinase
VFIAFEGGEACGKSTQAALLADHLRTAGHDVVLTREPGGTEVGQALRELLLSPTTGAVNPRAEALLMAADRAQHVAEVVRPALTAGRHVITDRYVGSSLSYQGFGRGLDLDELARLSVWATEGLWPDLVVLLEAPASVAAERLGGDLDRFEGAGRAFHDRVAEGFRTLAAADPERWVVVDGAPAIDDVAAAVRAAVRERLGLAV